jgi:hypothetical protein
MADVSQPTDSDIVINGETTTVDKVGTPDIHATQYDAEGYDAEGYDRNEKDRDGCDKYPF